MRTCHNTISLDCIQLDSILDIKYKIEEKTCLPAALQHLLYAGKPLTDEQTLRFYNIRHESTLQLTRRLPAGMRPLQPQPGIDNYYRMFNIYTHYAMKYVTFIKKLDKNIDCEIKKYLKK